jgi:parallel beta-helix repeat protein
MPRTRFGILPLLLLATATTAFAQRAPLRLTLDRPDLLDGNFNATVEYAVENTGDTDLNDVRLEIEEGNQAIILSWAGPALSCQPGPQPLSSHNLRCTIDTLAAHDTAHLGVVHHFLKPYARTYIQLLATVGGAVPGAVLVSDVRFFHDFPVTNTADEGPGSLRQAIADVNAKCTFGYYYDSDPCRISFTIAATPPSGGWFTIAPQSPLPVIMGSDMTIDAATQTKLGDTNPDGPEIFLLGDHAGDVDGLRFRGGSLDVRGLAIGGFARNGIDTSGSGSVRNCYLGVDPTGRSASPNGLRGLMSANGLEVTGNVIGGNGRSGVFFTSGYGASVTNNRIGVAADSDLPLPNGASGIFIGEYSNNVTIADNVIGNSGDFGIAIARTAQVTTLRNRIFNSRWGAIDVGLDGPTINNHTPTITSVRYDAAAGTTTITGTAFAPTPGFTTVQIYANRDVGPDGFAEEEEYLGV